MASSRTSQSIRRGRDSPPVSGSPQARHRSESRCLADRTHSVKHSAHRRHSCPGTLDVGHAVRVFSRTAHAWVDGVVVELPENGFVYVEYEIGEYWCGKTLHRSSSHLAILPAHDISSEEECDPECISELYARHHEGLRDSMMSRLKKKKFDCLKGVGNGVLIWAALWTPTPLRAHDDVIILYHYTNKAGFKGIRESSELQVTLLETCKNPYDTCFGDALYATCKAPDHFGSKGDILTNNYGGVWKGMEDPADYCIPLRVPRNHAYDVRNEAIPGLEMAWNTKHNRSPECSDPHEEIEEVPHRPGFNRHGKPARDRDIWVIAMPDNVGKVANLADIDVMSVKIRNHHSYIREKAAQACRKAVLGGNQSALDVAIDALKDPDTGVRQTVVQVVGGPALGCNQRALDVFKDSLKDPDPEVRSKAAQACRELAIGGNPRALHFLIDSLKDLEVQQKAVQAVGEAACGGQSTCPGGNRHG